MKRSTGYSFNTMQDIKSHSSTLFNERMAILFYLLDMESIELNKNYMVPEKCNNLIHSVAALNRQIYKNVRTLLRNNPVLCTTLNLNTKDRGSYVTDVHLSLINKMILYLDTKGYTMRSAFIMTEELNNFEMSLKDVLQYYNYFIRPNFIQKPDIYLATERYKSLADEMTVEQLRSVVGKNNKVNFDDIELVEPGDLKLPDEVKNQLEDDPEEDDDYEDDDEPDDIEEE